MILMSLSGLLCILFLLIALTFTTVSPVLPARSPLADTIPRQLIDMGGGDNPCALLVEKSKQKLYLYANQKWRELWLSVVRSGDRFKKIFRAREG